MEVEVQDPPASIDHLAILIADDHHLVREGLRLMVRSLWPHAQVVEAADGRELQAQARLARPPALALVDLNMPGMDRGARLTALARDFPELPIVVVSALTSSDVVRRALALPNVVAFVPKSADSALMRRAIDAALAGRKLPYECVCLTSAFEPDPALTPRMSEIRALLQQGMSNKRIAAQLGLTEGTVKNYMSDIFRLLNVSNRTQAAQFDPDSS